MPGGEAATGPFDYIQAKWDKLKEVRSLQVRILKNSEGPLSPMCWFRYQGPGGWCFQDLLRPSIHFTDWCPKLQAFNHLVSRSSMSKKYQNWASHFVGPAVWLEWKMLSRTIALKLTFHHWANRTLQWAVPKPGTEFQTKNKLKLDSKFHLKWGELYTSWVETFNIM